MNLSKQVFVYSIGTDAMYNEDEKFFHNRLLKLYALRKTIKDRENKKKKDPWQQNEGWKYSSVNRIIKKEKNKLTELLNSHLQDTGPRILDSSALREKNIISLFESSLTRALGLNTNDLTKDIFVVNVYFFQVFESIVKNGFIFNGEKYVFFTSSAGQIRQKKAVFIKESQFLRLQKKLMCGLTLDSINEKGGMNVNKFCAYLALNSSATSPWEDFDIDRAIVVDDFETHFSSLVDYIDYQTYEIERKEMEVEIPCTDGWGLVDGDTTRMCRLPWIKGLLTNFPLQDYLREECTPDQWIVTDIWGTKHDVVKENIKYIFSKSQMKLHSFYSSWEEYKEYFKQYGCTANYCNMEEDCPSNTKINYQMLQQLVNVTDDEIAQLVKKSVIDIENIGADYRTNMEILGATEFNKHPSLFQQDLMIYPELFRDPYYCENLKATKQSLVKQAKAGRLKINGKYLFVAPNPLVFCEWLFKGIQAPKEQLEPDEVYTNQFPNDVELALLRSPSLGKEWGIKTNKRTPELDRWLGNTNCIYTSSYDTISKLLSFDCDGDKLLVLQDKNLVKLGKRLMKDTVPLYYEMKKAKPALLTPENIYNGISLAFTAGNIGPASNLISIVKNNNEADREEADKVVKWLTMEVNFLIDGAKTLFFLERPKEVDKIIKKHTKGKLPNFFMYAKDKTKDQVEKPNNSTMNRIAKAIPMPKMKYCKTVGKFDYRMLMNQEALCDTRIDNPIIKSYDYWNTHQPGFVEADVGKKDQDLYKYKKIRENIIADTGEDVDYIVNTLVEFLYNNRKASAKKTLRCCFSEEIHNNIVDNVEKFFSGTKICPICGKRFTPKPKAQRAITCSDDCCVELNRIKQLDRNNKNN